MKRLIMFIFATLTFIVGMAQTQDEVTLTVTGEGSSKEEATNNALRNAIAQAYGVFVSANTQILNDEVVKDEIATVTSGNIKEYKEIASINLSNGRKEVTVQATVSISKLISYAKSKGASAEFEGALFARNIKIAELNKENERKVMNNLLSTISICLPNCYDRTLRVSEPELYGDNYVLIPMYVDYTPNDNLETLAKEIINILKSISKKSEYTGVESFPFQLNFDSNYGNYGTLKKGMFSFDLRNTYKEEYVKTINTMFDNYFCHFQIIDNRRQVSEISIEREMQYTGGGAYSFTPQTKIATGFFQSTKVSLRQIPYATLEAISEDYREALFFDWLHFYPGKLILKPNYPQLSFAFLISKSDISNYSSFILR